MRDKEKKRKYDRRYYQKHKEKRKRYAKEYHRTHREEAIQYQKEYRKTHRKQLKQRKKEYWKKHKQYYREHWLKTTEGKIRCVKKRHYTGYCELCGKENTRIGYHHWDDENPSKGLWVCMTCHWLCEATDKKQLYVIQRYLKFKKALNRVTADEVFEEPDL